MFSSTSLFALAFAAPAPLCPVLASLPRLTPTHCHRHVPAPASRRPQRPPHAAVPSPLSPTPSSPDDGPHQPDPTLTHAPEPISTSSSSSPLPHPKPLPNRWAIVVAASVVHALHATAVYVGPSTLLSPMRASLSLSVAQITLPLNVYRAVQAVFLIPAGFVLDAVGPQRSLRVSITAAALLVPLLPLVTTLTQLIILQALFSVTKLFGGLSALLLITTGAFGSSHRLGTVTSVLLSGYSFAGFLAPAIIGTLSSRFGWRVAFSVLSTLFIVIALPLTFHFLRENRETSPELDISFWGRFQQKLGSVLKRDIGVFDGSAPGVEAVLERQPLRTSAPAASSDLDYLANLDRTGSSDMLNISRSNVLSRASTSSQSAESRPPPATDNVASNSVPGQARKPAAQSEGAIAEPENDPLFTGPFLTIAMAVSAFSFTMNIVFDHLLVFLKEDFGMSFNTAAFYMSALNLIALFSKLVVGPIADRYNKALLISFFSIMGVVASVLLLDFSGLTFTVTTSLQKVIGFVVLCTYFLFHVHSGRVCVVWVR